MTRAKEAGRNLERRLIRLLLQVTPPSRHIVINGFPVDEGNAIEILRACAARYAGRIYWLVPDPHQARQILETTGADPDARVEIVRHRSFVALWRFVTAEASLFTHGLFGNPRRVKRKVMVNLWHGGGFKGSIMCDSSGRSTIHSDYLVASSAQFGKELARQCQLPPNGLLLTGNPRTDQFRRTSPADVGLLGIDTNRPFVIWMPTFRHNKGRGLTSAWSDLAPAVYVSPNARMKTHAALLTREFGINVVVKPHPQDAEMRAIDGATVVTNDDLRQSGIQLYELLGASAGLLTDYSSVWIDYLALDRPIGFVVPDEDGYTDGRGFNPPDALDWLPGPRLADEAGVRAFGTDVLAGGSTSAARRREVAAHIGHVTSDRVADDVLDHLERHRVFSAPLVPAAYKRPAGE